MFPKNLRTRKTVIYPSLILVSIAIAIWASYWIAETFFFDKFFYQKSFAHGYSDRTNLAKFGKRTEDLIELATLTNNLAANQSVGEKILGVKTQDDETYTIAILGDSNMWGLGTRHKYTIARKLSKMLNRHRKTKIISLTFPGESITDHLYKFGLANQFYDIDLFIIDIFVNDLLLNKDILLAELLSQKAKKTALAEVEEIINQCKREFPEAQLIYTSENEFPLTKTRQDIFTEWEMTLKNKPNLCIFKTSLERLPSNKTIYFVSHDGENYLMEKVKSILYEKNKYVISPVDDVNSKLPSSNFVISQVELHPNRTMHKIFAEILYEEILNNPEFNYTYK